LDYTFYNFIAVKPSAYKKKQSVSTIGHCDHLKEGLSPHDKKMAFYAFEQISGVDHMFTSIQSGLTDYLWRSAPNLVAKYSAAPRIEKQMKEERKQVKLIMAILQGLGLMSTAGLGLYGIANPEVALVAPVKVVLDLTVNSYISTTGVIKESMTSC
jgi:hypothetical protein